MNHRTATSNIQTNLNYIREAVCTHPQAFRGVFLVLGKLKIFKLDRSFHTFPVLEIRIDYS